MKTEYDVGAGEGVRGLGRALTAELADSPPACTAEELSNFLGLGGHLSTRVPC